VSATPRTGGVHKAALGVRFGNSLEMLISNQIGNSQVESIELVRNERLPQNIPALKWSRVEYRFVSLVLKKGDFLCTATQWIDIFDAPGVYDPVSKTVELVYPAQAEILAMPGPSPIALPDPVTFIRTIRGQRVILDSDLAKIYGVPTFRFNEAVKRNRDRFPEDFLFQLTREEFSALTSQFAILKPGRGQHRKYAPFAFTEHGALQAANVLNSPKACTMSIYVIRAFIRMREELSANQAIAKRLAEIDNTLLTHDAALRDLYQKIRPLLLPPQDPPRRKIGFKTDS